MTEPVRPTNAVLKVGDEDIPLEIVYNRQTESGIHVWRTTPRVQVPVAASEDIRFFCDVLPPRTHVEIDWEVVDKLPAAGPGQLHRLILENDHG